MTFLNLILLGGTLAFAVPLLIHLLHRNRFRVVRWGAMHLLRRVVQTNQRRMRLEQMLLLGLRCLLPVLLALGLAQPVFTGWRQLAGEVPSSVVALLDDSYSMQAGTEVRSNFTAAVEECSGVLNNQPSTSDATVLLLGSGAEPVASRPTTDMRQLLDLLRDLKAEGGAARPVDGLTAAAAAFAEQAHGHRTLVVFSDFQRADWGGPGSAARERLLAARRGLPVETSVLVFRCGAESRPNVCVESLDLPRQALGVGQACTVRAHLRNHDALSHPDLRVYFRADGRQFAAAQVALEPGALRQVEFTCTFDRPGSHLVEVEADTADLRADNVLRAGVQVLDRLPVLLVDGDPRPQRFAGETAFLQAALQPFRSSGTDAADVITAETSSVAELQEAPLAKHLVLVLANVARLDEAQLRAMEAFVRVGGGLIIFLGDKVEPDWYNERLFAGGSGLLPARLGEQHGGEERTALPGPPYDYPPLTLFNDAQAGDLTRAVVRSWYRLEVPTVGEQPATVGVRLKTGDPFLVQKSFGHGTVILCATACDADGSNLPQRPFFVPLMQRLVAQATANTMPPRNVPVGLPLLAYLDAGAVNRSLTMVGPDGRPHAVKAVPRGPRSVVEYGEARRPGLYVLQDGEQPIHFVAGVDRAESRLELLTDAEVAELARELEATEVRSFQEYMRFERHRRVGREVSRPLLVAVLALLFAELWLVQRITRSKA